MVCNVPSPSGSSNHGMDGKQCEQDQFYSLLWMVRVMHDYIDPYTVGHSIKTHMLSKLSTKPRVKQYIWEKQSCIMHDIVLGLHNIAHPVVDCLEF